MDPSSYEKAVDSYLRDCRRKGLRPDTLRYYTMVLGRIGDACDLGDLADLTLERVRAFQDEPGRLSPNSVRGFLRALRTFSGWIVDEGLVAHDPLARLRLPRVDEGVVVAPTDRELIDLLWAAAPALRTVLAVLVGTGLRVSDVAILSTSGLRPAQLVIERTKNRSGRLVPLDPVLEALLVRHVAGLPEEGQPGPLFLSRTGRRLTPDTIRQVLAEARSRAEIAVRVTPHIVRHWHARDLGAHGTTDRLLCARMGWRSPALIGRYAPVAPYELALDVARYAPLVRLRDDGLLDGLFPRSVLEAFSA